MKRLRVPAVSSLVPGIVAYFYRSVNVCYKDPSNHEGPAMPVNSRKHTASGADYRAVVMRAGPSPTGRAQEDHVDPKDVSYQPTDREKRFIERLSALTVEPIARAEAECVVRRTLMGFGVTNLNDRKVLQTEAAKFGITLKI
jgi:hypothetical protein